MKFKILSIIITAILLTGCASSRIVSPETLVNNPPVQSGVENKEPDVQEPIDVAPATPTEGAVIPLEEQKTGEEKPNEQTLYLITNYTGKALPEAKTGMANNFSLTIIEETNNSVASGRIISQTPSNGSYVQGTGIKIVVSKGPAVEIPKPAPTTNPTPAPETKLIELKDGTGKNGIEFASEMTLLGFKIEINEKFHETVADNLIIEMGTKPGQYPEGTTVQIVISKGKDPSVPVVNTWTKELPNNYSVTYQGAIEDEILRLLNEYRVANGLGTLTLKSDLKGVARWKSESMIQCNYFSHNTPTLGDIKALELTTELFGYTQYNSIGENLHAVYGNGVKTDAQEIITDWKNSPSHNTNMLRPEWKYVGIGVAYTPKAGSRFDSTDTFTAVQIFGRN